MLDKIEELALKKRIGNKIRELRINKGLTQTELGKMIGKSGNTITGWEKGKVRPDSDMIGKLCAIFDVTPNEFFGWDDEGTTSTDDYTFTAEGEVIYHNKQIIIMDEWPEEMKTEILNFMQYVKTKYNVE